MPRITKDMLIEEIIEKYPSTVGPLTDMGVQCFVCGEPTWGTLEENVISKGLTNLDEILDVLNKVAEEEEKKKAG